MSATAGRDTGRDTGYVPYVDGLRAVAILSVVGFHIGLPGFSGGFVGVDVFFVISGFLIIGHIVSGIERGRFSLADFYARRVLRLLPLLLTVILAICAIAPFILVTPDQYSDFGGSASAAALMKSNYFFLANQGYFDHAADTKPLLHTWSLGVEAQFYLIAPIVLGGAALLGARRRGLVFTLVWLLVTALSLAGCVAYSHVGKNHAFFMVADRAWEFAAGAAATPLALRLAKLPRVAIDGLGLAGLAIVVACVFLYDGSLVYPSAWPVAPVLGATLILASGEAAEGAAVKRLLALKPLVGIGLVSYGWYLWHWPLITYTRIVHFGSHDLASDGLIGGVLGLVLAVGTYFVIERPVARHKSMLLARGKAVTVAAGLAACGIAAVPGYLFEHSIAHSLQKQLGAEAWPTKINLHHIDDACIMPDNGRLLPTCDVASSPKLGLLLGDSHARDTYPVMSAKAAATGAKLVTLVRTGCPPLLKTYVLSQGQRQHCTDDLQKAVDNLASAHAPLSFAVLSSNWIAYLGAERIGDQERVLADDTGRAVASDQIGAFQHGLERTIHALRDMGVRRILIVAPEPDFRTDAPECLLRSKRYGMSPDFCTRPLADLSALHGRIVAAMAAAAGGAADVRIIDPFAALCDVDRCWQHRDGVPLYLDDNHLSPRGLDLVYRLYAPDLAWVFGEASASLQ